MNNWVDLVVVTIVGGILRYELEAFLKRKHNQEVEEVQKTIAVILARQLSRQEEVVDLLTSIHRDIQKG